MQSNYQEFYSILPRHPLSDESLQRIIDDLKANTIIHLDLNGCQLTEDQVIALTKAFLNNTSLTHLDLTYNALNSRALDAIAAWLSTSPALMVLHLSSNNEVGKHRGIIAALEKTKLKAVYLEDCGLSGDTISALTNSLSKLDHIELIDLSNNMDLIRVNMESLIKLLRTRPALECKIDQVSAEAFQRIHKINNEKRVQHDQTYIDLFKALCTETKIAVDNNPLAVFEDSILQLAPRILSYSDEKYDEKKYSAVVDRESVMREAEVDAKTELSCREVERKERRIRLEQFCQSNGIPFNDYFDFKDESKGMNVSIQRLGQQYLLGEKDEKACFEWLTKLVCLKVRSSSLASYQEPLIDETPPRWCLAENKAHTAERAYQERLRLEREIADMFTLAKDDRMSDFDSAYETFIKREKASEQASQPCILQ